MERDQANGGPFLPSDTFTTSHRGLARYAQEFFPRDGELASYSVAVDEQFAQAADYPNRVSRGNSPKC
jgi:hypothetical protein